LEKKRPDDPITAKIVTVEEIVSNPAFSCTGFWNWGDGCGSQNQFDDNAARIRNYIRFAYTNLGTEYVLLGGDADKNVIGGETEPPIVPVRYFSVLQSILVIDFTSSYIPSDVYYSNLDTSWDLDNDSNFGEEDVEYLDLYSEINVGRAPVDSMSEINNWVNKTIYYENNQNVNTLQSLMVGEYLGFGGISEYATASMEEIRFGSTIGVYSSLGFIPPFTENQVLTLYDTPDYVWDRQELIDLINSDSLQIINHLGHANSGEVFRLPNYIVDYLTNLDPIFIYSHGCYAGSFDNAISGEILPLPSDSISEYFLIKPNGAFAVVMNSRFGFGALNSTDSPSQQFNRIFWDGAFLPNTEKNLGKLNNYSHENNNWRLGITYYAKYVYYETNLLGDPEIKLKLPKLERNLRIDLNVSNKKFNSDLTSIPVEIKVTNQGINPESNVEIKLVFNNLEIDSQIIEYLNIGESKLIFYTIDPILFSNLLESIELTAIITPKPTEPTVDNIVTKGIWFYNYEIGFDIFDENTIFDCSTNQNPEGKPILKVVGPLNGCAITINGASSIKISNCVFKGWGGGVVLLNSNNSIFENNYFENNLNCYVLYNSNTNLFKYNSINLKTFQNYPSIGFYVNASNYNIFNTNSIEEGYGSAITLLDSNHNVIVNNNTYNVEVLRANALISLGKSNYNQLKNNSLSNSDAFVRTSLRLNDNSNNNLIEDNNISNIYTGIYLYESSDNNISHNFINLIKFRGIVGLFSNNTILKSNKISNSKIEGIQFNQSNNTIISDNFACNNLIDVYIENNNSTIGNYNNFNVVTSNNSNWPIYGVHYCYCNEVWDEDTNTCIPCVNCPIDSNIGIPNQ